MQTYNSTKAEKTAIGTLVIGVLRVSSKPQQDKFGYEVQQRAIQDRADSMGLQVNEWIRFQESATKALHREQFQQILSEIVSIAGEKRYQRIVVIFARPDRLGRDGVPAFFFYTHILNTAGVEVRFGIDDVEPGTDYADNLLFMHAFKSAKDAETIRKNTSQGRHAKARTGKAVGPTAPWHLKVINGRFERHPEQWQYARQSVEIILNGGSSLAVVRLWREKGIRDYRGQPIGTAKTVTRWLRSRWLVGIGSYGPVEYERRYDLAVCSESEYQVIEQRLATNQRMALGRSKPDLCPLSKHVYHMGCGPKARMWVFRDKQTQYLRCSVCGKRVRADLLWPVVESYFNNMTTNVETVREHIRNAYGTPDAREKAVTKDLLAVESDIANVQRRIERIKAAVEGDDDAAAEFADRYAALKAERERFTQQANGLRDSLKDIQAETLTDEQIESLVQEWMSTTLPVDDETRNHPEMLQSWRDFFRDLSLRCVWNGDTRTLSIIFDAAGLSPTVRRLVSDDERCKFVTNKQGREFVASQFVFTPSRRQSNESLATVRIRVERGVAHV